MTLDFRKLQQRLEGKTPGTLYLLTGDESFLVQEALQILKMSALEPGTMEFNCDIFDAAEASAGTVRDAVEMLPMMSPRRVVVYRGADALKDKDWEVLFPLFERPVDSTTFVIICESLDKRKKAFKKINDVGVVVDLKSPYESQLLDWIDYLAFRHGIRVTQEAAQTLKQFVGANLTELNNELTKLKEFIGDRQQIEVDDILKSVSHSRIDRIFDLTDAIAARDRGTALHMLANLLEHGQSEVGILAMVTRHFRILSQIKDGQRDGLSGSRLCTKAGIPQFLLSQYLQQTRHWDEPKIQDTFAVLLDTDRALKSSSVPPHIWLENFVLKTCR